MIAQIGGTTYSNIAADETLVQVKNVTGGKNLLAFNFTCFNPDATNKAYVQFFDVLAASVVLGTTVPKFVLPLPPGGGIDGGMVLPRKFNVALTFAVTTTPGGLTAPVTDCIVQFDYL